jgi:hypothetical protein
MENISINQLIKMTKQGGSKFFDEETMSFFQTEVHDEIFNGKYFITSEQSNSHYIWDGERRWSIRIFSIENEKVDINTVGEFGEYKSLEEAIKAVKEGKI